jgi:hypothetical protein
MLIKKKKVDRFITKNRSPLFSSFTSKENTVEARLMVPGTFPRMWLLFVAACGKSTRNY